MQSKTTTSISNSWDINAEEWIKVVDEQQIPFRKMPHRWYFITLEDWVNLFKKVRLTLFDLKEPKDVDAELTASIIFTLKKSK
jgi:hypothetical protein